MTQYFPIVVEQESNGTLRGIRGALAAHLDALRALGRKPRLKAEVSVLRRDVYATRRDSWRFVGVGALLGRGTSRAKAEASRSNGRKGGRPCIARAIPVN
ncbi:MAG: hypothetical protein DMF95_18425 [Acidobacteria bacterium]|nr:MAG: hypothetical protein DMF95_18425 [Acidobacteriota bacterium]